MNHASLRSLCAMAVLLFVTGCSLPTGAGPGPRAWIDDPLDGATLPLGPVVVQSHASSEGGTASAALLVNGAQVRVDNAHKYLRSIGLLRTALGARCARRLHAGSRRHGSGWQHRPIKPGGGAYWRGRYHPHVTRRGCSAGPAHTATANIHADCHTRVWLLASDSRSMPIAGRGPAQPMRWLRHSLPVIRCRSRAGTKIHPGTGSSFQTAIHIARSPPRPVPRRDHWAACRSSPRLRSRHDRRATVAAAARRARRRPRPASSVSAPNRAPPPTTSSRCNGAMSTASLLIASIATAS